MELERFSLGIGDRFGREGAAQLRALQAAGRRGVAVTPVWNKSNREHAIIGSTPADTRRAADAAAAAAGWTGAYFVDADHVGPATVDRFIAPCDFFTIDVADAIGRPAGPDATAAFLRAMSRFEGSLRIPGLPGRLTVTEESLRAVAAGYLSAIEEAALVYRRVEAAKGPGAFLVEISMDETAAPQAPAELLFILGAAARAGIPVRTIAPKFSGAFLKGVDYVGDSAAFAREFEADLAVVEFAKTAFGLPATLKISVHSGSDKFSLYPAMRAALDARGAGVHLKTAGTTWLEEAIGLAAAGGDGLAFMKDLYAAALARFDELAAPYRAVIDIDREALPDDRRVGAWPPDEFAAALRHDPADPRFDRNLRQLVHIAFRIAAEAGPAFDALLTRCRETIEAGVTENLLRRHVEPLFLGDGGPGGKTAAATGHRHAR